MIEQISTEFRNTGAETIYLMKLQRNSGLLGIKKLFA